MRDELKEKMGAGLYDSDNKLDMEVFKSLRRSIFMYKINTVEEEQNLNKVIKLLESQKPKLKNIAQLQKLNKNEALYPKSIFDQLIDVFKNDFSNWA